MDESPTPNTAMTTPNWAEIRARYPVAGNGVFLN